MRAGRKQESQSSQQEKLLLYGGGKPVRVEMRGQPGLTIVAPNRRLAVALEKAKARKREKGAVRQRVNERSRTVRPA